MKKKILISTGGSGGHVIPATILYEHLKHNFDVSLTTDKRGTKFLELEKYNIEIIDIPKIKKNIFLLPINLIYYFFLTIKNIFFIKKKNFDILISTGGYMSVPFCIAAMSLRIKIFLFEPNMVLGRSNKLFLKTSKKIFCYSDKIKNYPKKYKDKIFLIEPLLRKEFYSTDIVQKPEIEKKINLLIIGGSQGAQFFETILKNTIIKLSNRYKVKIIQQLNISNFDNLKKFYYNNNIEYEFFDFDKNILKYISQSNLCITRAGSSTLSELTFLNIPYIAIPLPSAKDNHQLKNAIFYEERNCCWLLNQDEINDDILFNKISNIIDNKEDYLIKKKNMKKFCYQNTWNNINQKLIKIINEN